MKDPLSPHLHRSKVPEILFARIFHRYWTVVLGGSARGTIKFSLEANFNVARSRYPAILPSVDKLLAAEIRGLKFSVDSGHIGARTPRRPIPSFLGSSVPSFPSGLSPRSSSFLGP